MIRFIGDGGHAKVCMEMAAPFELVQTEWWFIAVGDNASRAKERQRLGTKMYAQLVHSSASKSANSLFGFGSVMMEGAIVQAGAQIGEHVIINAGAVVTHDCIIEDYAHIAPGAHLCGGVHVGEGALVGVGVGIEPGVKIPAWSIVKREKYVITLASG